MDSQDRDESKTRRRQELLARRIGEALDQLKPIEKRKCPDAEIIAAYAEQALGPAESAEWEGHFAACARCRNILRVLAASADTPLAEKEVAQLGKLVSAVRSPVERTRPSALRTGPRFADWRTRWLAPALGVAAVLAVWFTMRPPWRATDRSATGTLVAQAPKEELPSGPAPVEEDRLSRIAPQQERKAAAAPARDQTLTKPLAPNSTAEAPAKVGADAGAAPDKVLPTVGGATNSMEEKKKLNRLADGRQIQPPPIPPPPQVPPQAQTALPPAAPQPGAKVASNMATAGGLQAESNTGAVSNAPARDKQAGAVQAEAGAARSGPAGQEFSPAVRPSEQKAFAVFRPVQKDSALLKATSGSIVWRAGKGGIIERSTDAGKTWISQASPSQEDWLAGAAVSDTLCWLAGRKGAIARTVDGEDWERIAPPTQAYRADATLPDWTGITARDAQTAAITAGDGRKFATSDGGKTWQLQ